MEISSRLASIQERVVAACESADRSPTSVRLLAASKTVEIGRIHQAVHAGQLLFGESRAQELRDKYQKFGEQEPGAEWHFIGHLQRNKVKYLIGRVTMVHTIDRLDVAEAIAQRIRKDDRHPPMPVLVEVNLGSEQSKSGVPIANALELCERIHEISELDLQGLMAIPPWNADPDQSRPYFIQLAQLASRGRERGLPLNELSMGMSHDFEQAIACGATIIRVGRKLFGPRN